MTRKSLMLRASCILSLPQFLSSAPLGQSAALSHSGLTLLMQEVELHSKFPLQFKAGKNTFIK